MTVEELEAAQVKGCGSLLHLVQAALRGPASPIWAVTRGAQPVGSEPAPPAVAQSPVWGLGRVIGLEHPEVWGGLVDLDANDPDADALFDEIVDSDGEDQVARRGSARYVARLRRSRDLKTQPVRLRPDSAYLITGGLGRLGLKVARWMAEQGARHLVLMGRKGLPERAAWTTLAAGSDAGRAVAVVKAIEDLGATVEVVAADAGDAGQMSAVLSRFGQGSPALRGIIHAAAAPGSVSVRDMSLEALSAMLRPKMAGAWVLHRLTAAMELDFFLMFSSTTGLLGARDLGHYAAANTFLDALAHYRRGAGRPALSINWGVWDELRDGTAGAQKTFAGAGLRHMPSPRALRALGLVWGSEAPQVVVASVDWNTLKPVYEARRRRPFLEQVGTPTKSKPAGPAETGSDILQRLEAARPQDRHGLLVEHVRGAVAKVLRLEPGREIALTRGLFDLGMDSLMSVELKSRLEKSLGRPLPSTLTFNYPNVGALVDYLAKELSLSLSAPAEPVVAPAEMAATAAGGDDISEDELAMQLAEKLAELR
jgi:acyl carrier protein